MFDAYDVLGLERRLVLGDECLRERFQQLGKERHPDAAGGSVEGWRELNEAYELLRSPSRRLRHWLALGGVEGDPRGAIDGGLVEVFGRVGGVIQQADGLLKRRDAARTVLSRALLERDAALVREQLAEALAEVEALVAAQVAQFEQLDEQGQQMAAEEAWAVARSLGFLEKWRGQLRERYGALY